MAENQSSEREAAEILRTLAEAILSRLDGPRVDLNTLVNQARQSGELAQSVLWAGKKGIGGTWQG